MTTSSDDVCIAREKYVQETVMVNNRITWLLTSQTLLFAAFGVVGSLAGTAK